VPIVVRPPAVSDDTAVLGEAATRPGPRERVMTSPSTIPKGIWVTQSPDHLLADDSANSRLAQAVIEPTYAPLRMR
jgi:hypothetical protein